MEVIYNMAAHRSTISPYSESILNKFAIAFKEIFERWKIRDSKYIFLEILYLKT